MNTPAKGWKLFIPGPTHMRREVLAAQAVPMISHRGDEARQLLADLLPGVRAAMGTKGDVVVLSCSSTCAMEAVSRSVVRPGKKVLHLTNGNFSKLWWELSVACGYDAVNAEQPWGEGWDEERAAAELKKHGALDAVMVTHCETSTGAMTDVAGVIRAVRAAQPEALVCSDVTSTATGMPVDFDAVGLDVALGGVQKCWAVPSALALGALSPRAKARMEANKGRGWTNDFLSCLQFQEKFKETSTTPAIPQMQALRQQIRDIEKSGGMAARFARHLAMQKLVLDWVAARGLGTLAPARFRSPAVTSIAANGRFEIAPMIAGLMAAGYFIQPGFGKTAPTHWRIGHMGDHTVKCVGELLAETDRVLAKIGAKVTVQA